MGGLASILRNLSNLLSAQADRRSRSTTSRFLLVAAGVLAPATALACGTCVDMLLRNASWWGTWPYWAAGALLLDRWGFALYARLRTLPPSAKPESLATSLFVVLLLLVSVGFFGTLVPCALLSLAILVSAIRSRTRLANQPPRERRAVLGLRVALPAVATLAFVLTSVPSAVPTSDLLRNVLYKGPKLDPPRWNEAELLRRGDVAAVVAELALETTGRTHLTDRGYDLLRLHRFLGGAPAARKAGCDLWRATPAGDSSLAESCADVP